ncbi:MAG: hypothetical protein N4A63_13030 [Vallitalea sp.]|jgi:hypothetical protein|nr:hypothetical protein [Vallitalea sp.]
MMVTLSSLSVGNNMNQSIGKQEVNKHEVPCVDIETEEESIWDDVYSIALDSFITVDEGLNSDMEYIAINSQTLSNASDEDIIKIKDYFIKYEVEIIDESFNILSEKGMVKKGNYIEGLLLEITDVNIISDNKVIIEGSKFRSGLGAVGVKSTVIKSNGEWQLKSADMTWIS